MGNRDLRSVETVLLERKSGENFLRFCNFFGAGGVDGILGIGVLDREEPCPPGEN